MESESDKQKSNSTLTKIYKWKLIRKSWEYCFLQNSGAEQQSWSLDTATMK